MDKIFKIAVVLVAIAIVLLIVSSACLLFNIPIVKPMLWICYGSASLACLLGIAGVLIEIWSWWRF